MNWLRSKAPATPPSPHPVASPLAPMNPSSPEQRGVDFGWKVHAAQEAWTARVDGKAALYLATQTAVLAAIFAGFANGKSLDSLDGLNRGVAIAGTVISVAAVIIAGCAVIPMLNKKKKLEATYADNLIYFGHLRYWKAPDLRARLAGLTAADELDQLSLQLVALSVRNWRKHVFLRTALLLGAVGALMVITAYIQERICG